MNYKGLIFGIAMGFVSCADDAQKTTQANTPTESLKITAGALHGFWVRQDYITDLEKLRSPRTTYPLLQGISAISFDSTKKEGALLKGFVSLNNHEGSTFSYNMSENTLQMPDETQKYQCHLSITEHGVVLSLNDGTHTKSYVHTPTDLKIGAGGSIDFWVNKILLAGKWHIKDENTATETPIIVGTDGSILGWEGINYAYIVSDFSLSDPNDIIFFYKNATDSKHKGVFAYEAMGKDSLKLFDVIADKNGMWEKTRLKYVLVRQK